MIAVETPSQRYSPVPHDLTEDPALPDGAVRLWARLHPYGWRSEGLDVEELAASWPGRPVTTRTITRWLAALHNAGWVTWTRARGSRASLDGRLVLHTERVEVRIVVSEVEESSDRRIQSSDRRIQTSDPTIRTSTLSPRQEAVKAAPKKVEEYKNLPPPHEETPITPPGGGGESPSASPPETYRLLAQAGVVTAGRYRDVPPHVARAAIKQAQQHKNPQNLGGLVARLLDRYRSGDWEAPPPPVRAVSAPPPLPEVAPLTTEQRRAILARAGKLVAS